jgi:hypothetical protein
MRTIIEEAAQAFEDRHDDRCLNVTECFCVDFVSRINAYEKTLERQLRDELVDFIKEEKHQWLPENKDRGALADWIESIFNNVIKFAEAKK